jgi:hypothetical protein
MIQSQYYKKLSRIIDDLDLMEAQIKNASLDLDTDDKLKMLQHVQHYAERLTNQIRTIEEIYIERH